MEHDDAGPFGDGGLGKPAHQAFAHAVALEAAAPLRRPILEPALAGNELGDELLLVAHLGNRLGVVVFQVIQGVCMSTDGEDVARGVARLVLFVPLLDDNEFSGLFEKRVETVQDHDVQVQKQGASLQVVQAGGKTGQLEPAVAKGPRLALVKLVKADHGDGLDLNAWLNALGIVGQADKAERALQVARDHAVEFVDVFGAVFAAPFDAQNIDSFHADSFTPKTL